jgi:hypothetical protein
MTTHKEKTICGHTMVFSAAKYNTAPKNNAQEGKAKMSLLPMDLLKNYLVPAYEEGRIKYRRESWRQGFYVSVLVDAALRHIEVFFWGNENWDPDAEKLGIRKHHLAGAVFSLLSILHTLDTRPELDDRPGMLKQATEYTRPGICQRLWDWVCSFFVSKK